MRGEIVVDNTGLSLIGHVQIRVIKDGKANVKVLLHLKQIEKDLKIILEQK